jgi:hypothetical protein
VNPQSEQQGKFGIISLAVMSVTALALLLVAVVLIDLDPNAPDWWARNVVVPAIVLGYLTLYGFTIWWHGIRWGA